MAVGVSTVVLVLSACGGAPQAKPDTTPRFHLDNQATEAQERARVDAFDIRNIAPTLRNGTIWTSRWSARRAFDGVDPRDRWFDADHGSATYRVARGRLYVTGSIPRMYVHDPKKRRQWRNVEVTMYFKRVSDTGIPYAGMTIVARSNHLDTESGRRECDTRGYGARMRYDGHIDFEKETAFPANQAVSNKTLWANGLPKGRWIGVKFLVYDRSDGVHLEMWVDLTNGWHGGRWRLVNRIVDDGRLFGNEPCAEGIDPGTALTASSRRAGSETGKPNLTVYFRSDGVNRDGLVYKWGSVREIRVRR